MIDIFIILFSSIAFLCYLALQVLLLHTFTPNDRVGFMFRLQLLLGVLLASSITIIFFLNVITIYTYVITVVFTQLIFHGLAVIYVLTIYSYLESAITVKLLMTIGSTQGLSLVDLRKTYSVSHIIKRRIERFLAMGVISKNGFIYEKTRKQTLFSLRERAIEIMNKCFPII